MFADFQKMIKGKLDKLTDHTSTSNDISRIPQRYTISSRQIQQLKLLSEGAFGFIWLAEDITSKQKYALKRVICMNQQRMKLAKTQLEIMLGLPKSKNLVQCYGGDIVRIKNGARQTTIVITLMELCSGGTLFDELQKRQGKGFTQRQLLQIIHSILIGLQSMHQAGYAHQDIKIENVLLTTTNPITYKLCDFGSSSTKKYDFSQIPTTSYSTIKDELQAVTTPMYRPPQMVDPYLQYRVDEKVDLWMLGCVIYTLCYFMHPFVDSNAVGIAGGVYRFPKYPSQCKYQVSEKMKDLIRNLLTPNPKYRPSAAQTIQIISAWNTVDQIPLNKQAQRRKEEENKKEIELDRLNKKVVQFDGDIPMEKLLQLQNKLKNKGEDTHATSFVQSKDTRKIMEFKPNQKPTQNNIQVSNSVNTNVQQKAPSVVNANDFWGNPFPNTQKKEQNAFNFDVFSNISAPQTQNSTNNTQNNTKNTTNFDEFFDVQPKPTQLPSQSKQTEFNLLDL